MDSKNSSQNDLMLKLLSSIQNKQEPQPEENNFLPQAILALAPILAGAAIGGARGGAVGGEAGLAGLKTLELAKERERQRQQELQLGQSKALESALKLSAEERAQKASARAEERQTQEFALSKEKLNLEKQKLMTELGSNKRTLDQLSPPNKVMVENLSKDSATKTAIANEIAQTVKLFDDPKINQTQKIKAGQGLLKVLNSTQGSDAVGAEEARRLGSLLEYQIRNITGPGPFWGRDLPEFRNQAATTVNRLSGAVESNKELINQALTGKEVGITKIPLIEKPILTEIPSAQAAPAMPDFNKMSSDDLKKYLGM